jgi:hypothetical protein
LSPGTTIIWESAQRIGDAIYNGANDDASGRQRDRRRGALASLDEKPKRITVPTVSVKRRVRARW